MTVTRWRCRAHPERPGIGICTSCSSTLCEECSSRVDGILTCRDCLTRPEQAPRSGWRSASAVLPALTLAPLAWGLIGYGLYIVVLSLGLLREWAAGG